MTAEVMTSADEPQAQAKPSDEERRKLVDEAIAKGERLVESEIEMAKLFLANGRIETARRRLQEAIERFAAAEAAQEARQLLQDL